MITVYVSIGNSDDKLTQAKWAEFYRAVALAVRHFSITVHGQWVSEPASAWQNACWCIEIDDDGAGYLRGHLGALAGTYDQDSIAWAEAVTAFISPS